MPLEVQDLPLVLKVCHAELQSVPLKLQGVPPESCRMQGMSLVMKVYILELKMCP